MVIDRPQPRRVGSAVLKILRAEGNVSLWGQRNATFGTDIFTRIYEAYKKIRTDQDYTISPTCAWCGEMYLLWARNSERLLNLEDFRLYFVTVPMLGFILERKLCFKNIVFRDWRRLVWRNIHSGTTLSPLLGCQNHAQRTAVIVSQIRLQFFFPRPFAFTVHFVHSLAYCCSFLHMNNLGCVMKLLYLCCSSATLHPACFKLRLLQLLPWSTSEAWAGMAQSV